VVWNLDIPGTGTWTARTGICVDILQKAELFVYMWLELEEEEGHVTASHCQSGIGFSSRGA